jgi:anti-sigma28 factor (negative regulator of flagellin synthesis)
MAGLPVWNGKGSEPMRISDAEVKKVLSTPDSAVMEAIVQIEEARKRDQDAMLVQELTAKVSAMEDRDEIIAELKARIEAGTYRPSAEDIVDGMVRRAIADQIR